MKLTIVRETETGLTIELHTTTSEIAARRLAATEATKEMGQIYITWYRDTDGQRGYLNRDGHNPVGHAW